MSLRFPALALVSVALSVGASAAAAQEAAGALPNPYAPAARTAPASTAADPRAEPALRAVIAGIVGGDLDYARFSDELAASIREQDPVIAPLLRDLGEVEDMRFLTKEQTGDIFLVRFAEVDTHWFIGFNPDGRIGALMFRPAPAPEAAPSGETADE